MSHFFVFGINVPAIHAANNTPPTKGQTSPADRRTIDRNRIEQDAISVSGVFMVIMVLQH